MFLIKSKYIQNEILNKKYVEHPIMERLSTCDSPPDVSQENIED